MKQETRNKTRNLEHETVWNKTRKCCEQQWLYMKAWNKNQETTWNTWNKDKHKTWNATNTTAQIRETTWSKERTTWRIIHIPMEIVQMLAQDSDVLQPCYSVPDTETHCKATWGATGGDQRFAIGSAPIAKNGSWEPDTARRPLRIYVLVNNAPSQTFLNNEKSSSRQAAKFSTVQVATSTLNPWGVKEGICVDPLWLS